MKSNTKYFLKAEHRWLCFWLSHSSRLLRVLRQALTWEQVKAKFEAANPVLKADAANVEEMKAEEITAFLRPNPQFTLSWMATKLPRTMGSGPPSRALPSNPTSVTCTNANTSGNCG